VKAKKKTAKKKPAAAPSPSLYDQQGVMLRMKFGGAWIDMPTRITRVEITHSSSSMRSFRIEGFLLLEEDRP
jgi:hypothetical protein